MTRQEFDRIYAQEMAYRAKAAEEYGVLHAHLQAQRAAHVSQDTGVIEMKLRVVDGRRHYAIDNAERDE